MIEYYIILLFISFFVSYFAYKFFFSFEYEIISVEGFVVNKYRSKSEYQMYDFHLRSSMTYNMEDIEKITIDANGEIFEFSNSRLYNNLDIKDKVIARVRRKYKINNINKEKKLISSEIIDLNLTPDFHQQ